MSDAPRLFRLQSALALAGLLILCFLVASFGAQFTPGEWYAALRKPAWTPPDAVFAPVWTVLFILMAVSAWLVWHTPRPERSVALGLFSIQLALNALWSWLFFGLRAPVLALADILLLWSMLVAVNRRFFGLRRAAGWLFLPYTLWVSYAITLNAGVVVLNP